MTKKLKILLFRILFSALIFIFALFINNEVFKFFLFILSYLMVSSNILIKAFKNILHGQIFDENFLMIIATFGAFYLRDYKEAVAIMLFYQVGELFQSYAVNKSRKSIVELMDIRPDYANLVVGNSIKKVSPEEVSVNDIILVKSGEKIPLDGVLVDGFSTLNASALTGESLPKNVAIGDEVISGCINLTGVIKIKVLKEFSESTVSKILDLVENSATKKAAIENFITKFAKYYTPTVVIFAFLMAIFPALLIAGQTFDTWIYRAITFLVISCPCALVISIPLSFFSGIGIASKNGILIKGGNYLEALSNAEIIVFDKTGTLTKGNFKVIEVNPLGISKEELLKVAAYVESYSHHPIAESIKNEYGKEIDTDLVKNINEIQGYGISANVDNKEVFAGNYKLMKEKNIKCEEVNSVGTIVHIAIENKYSGYLLISDEIKSDSIEAIRDLKALGIKQTIMLTGDKKEIANSIAKKLEIDKVYSELLPANKVEKMEDLLKEKSRNGKLIFVGDGINDAPVLARSDIGIAMGGIGSDAAIEASDIVIMSDELSKIPFGIKISKRTINIARQNAIFAIGVKLIVLGFGAFGSIPVLLAVFADVGVSVIAILNSIKMLLFYKK